MPPRTLLPPGCYDLLPPQAERETLLVSRLLSAFTSFGYEEVAPPLMEYTESLLAGRGAEFSTQVFRILDPDAQKVMGIRTDITLQVARIAASRLSAAERPLRLSYAGSILRMHADALREKRQFTQAGIELIGVESPEADAEVITVGATALQEAGIASITVDLNMPAIVSLLLQEDALNPQELEDVLNAIAHKDANAIQHTTLKHRSLLIGLLEAVGPAEEAMAKIKALPLPDYTQGLIKHMQTLLNLLKPLLSQGISLTLDATESRTFQYHSGISFSFFSKGITSELGRGGHYRIEREETTEPATGFTFYTDLLRPLLPAPTHTKRVYYAGALNDTACKELRAQGYVVIHALEEAQNLQQAAKQHACGYIYQQGTLTPL